MPFNGLGFGGGGFGRVGDQPTQQDPLQILNGGLSGTGLGDTAMTQATGVAQYGEVWASRNCLPCNTAILEMQGLINRVGYALGTPSGLSSDGKVGPSTVRSLQAIAQAAMARGAPVGMALGSLSGSAEVVAKNADKIRDLLRAFADALHAPTTGQASTGSNPPMGPYAGGGSSAPMNIPSGPSTTPTMTVVQQGNPPAFPPAGGLTPYTAAAPSFWKAKWPWIAAGGLLFAGVVTAAVIIMKPAGE